MCEKICGTNHKWKELLHSDKVYPLLSISDYKKEKEEETFFFYL